MSATETPIEQASWWEDPIDVLFSPVALFERRRHAPLGPPIAMLLGAAVLAYFLMMPVTTVVMQASMAENPEAAAAMQEFGTVFRVVGAIFAPIGTFVILAWVALLIWAFSRLFDLPATYGRALLIATYAAWIGLIGQILASVLIMITGTDGVTDLQSALSFGVLRFTGTEGIPDALVPLLGRIDLIAIWQATLWGIGLAVIYGAARMRAAGIAFAVLVLSALPEIIVAVLRPGP
jgi:hypothetical protein